MSTALEARPPKQRRNRPKQSQSRRLSDAFVEFDFAEFIYLQPYEGVILWNSAAAMRRNGYRPSGVAAYLNKEFGVQPHDHFREGGISIEALEYFERLVIREGVSAPSLLRDQVWGQA